MASRDLVSGNSERSSVLVLPWDEKQPWLSRCNRASFAGVADLMGDGAGVADLMGDGAGVCCFVGDGAGVCCFVGDVSGCCKSETACLDDSFTVPSDGSSSWASLRFRFLLGPGCSSSGEGWEDSSFFSVVGWDVVSTLAVEMVGAARF